MGLTLIISIAKASVTSLPMRFRNSRSWYITDSSFVISAIHLVPFAVIWSRLPPTHSTKWFEPELKTEKRLLVLSNLFKFRPVPRRPQCPVQYMKPAQ
jgi:phosphoglycerol transferase MdoB-like AlkP superfamily enzyme